MSEPKNRPTILIVDDEAINLIIMEELLVTNGYDVIKAENGRQAFDRAIETFPDLILLDIFMPEMGGYDTCSKLKGHPLTKDIPVIFVTSKTEEIDETLGFECGAADFMRKPISPSVLRARVKNHLALREAKTQLQELLSKTLLGSIRVLNDILIFIDPTFHSMLPRLKRYAEGIATYLDLADRWRLELAVMLSHIGCVAIPREIIKKITAGKVLTEDEQKMFDMHPRIAQDLISKIPRLKRVAKMIGNQRTPLDKSKLVQDLSQWDPVDLGVHLLRVVIDFERMMTSGMSAAEALSEMRTKKDVYSEMFLEALEAIDKLDQKGDVQLLMFDELQEGHVLKENLYTKSGALMVKRDKEMTANTIALLQPFAATHVIKEPIKVKRSLSSLDLGRIGVKI